MVTSNLRNSSRKQYYLYYRFNFENDPKILKKVTVDKNVLLLKLREFQSKVKLRAMCPVQQKEELQSNIYQKYCPVKMAFSRNICEQICGSLKFLEF